MLYELAAPHVPLRIPLDGLAILGSLGRVEAEGDGGDKSYRVSPPSFSLAIYPDDGRVGSVWYDDPTGRETEDGRAGKVKAYLARYGALANWELRLDNGWMRYWFDPKDGVAMVYGVHNDVLRFNQYDREAIYQALFAVDNGGRG